jgi:dethiobiotin synthetase
MPSFNAWPDRIWVTGTDTNVGKTVVSAALVRQLDASYWKPVQSGWPADDDTETVRQLADVPPERLLPPVYRFTNPLSPNQAAEDDGVVPDPSTIRVPDYSGKLVMEGAGGLMVPITADFMILDLMRKLAAPVVLVARTGLGTLNHTFLSLDALRAKGLPVLGVVLVGVPHPRNTRDIREIGRVRILAEIPPMDPVDIRTVTLG